TLIWAVVDVDVRGWVFAPQRGQLSRKSRLMVSLAKRLSGIPSQPVYAPLEEREELFDADAYGGGNTPSRPAMGARHPYATQEDIDRANEELLERLSPFLASPLAEVPITVFFYDAAQSQSRTVATNDGGHFYLRASLDFVPTSVRVLALENVSATETVNLLEEHGVSVVSDIDDTVKHTGITQGAKEMFRNTFVRAPEGLAVPGVAEWYQALIRAGAKMHYVSNSPWQLYPQIELFFVLAGLPTGSFHLKRYAGLQELFEPTLEKKRGALEMLLRDFPARRFILVGDSGESDLEAYTELVLAHPGRVLAVLIRDITTPVRRYVSPPQHNRMRITSDSQLSARPGSGYGPGRLARPATFSDPDL
ncbi:hypothetical protein KEM52_003255, partial [Ascosphaera acerosa]